MSPGWGRRALQHSLLRASLLAGGLGTLQGVMPSVRLEMPALHLIEDGLPGQASLPVANCDRQVLVFRFLPWGSCWYPLATDQVSGLPCATVLLHCLPAG